MLKDVHVIVGGFMSVDGKIAPADHNGREFSQYMSSRHEQLLHEIRANVDAVIIGVNTVIADNPILTVRAVEGKNPVRVILDSHARIPIESKILNTKEAPTLLVATKDVPKDKADLLKNKNVDILFLPAQNKKIDLNELLAKLSERGVKRVLVEGGGDVRWSFFEQKLVDELFVWITPTIWGGRAAPTLVGGLGFVKANDAVNLEFKSIKQVENILILWFNVKPLHGPL